jgi:hypothetical protein
MPLESMRSGPGGEFLILDDDNPHDGKGPKYAVLKIDSDIGRFTSVYDADPGFCCKDKVLQRAVDRYFESKNLEEFKELQAYRKYQQMATNDYGRTKMRYIIEDP